jgi:hypothetical protein
VTSFFFFFFSFFQICGVGGLAIVHKVGLAKFGYRSQKKVEILKEEHVGTYCLNMATSKNRFLLMWRLRPIFSKKIPFYHLHLHFLVTSDPKKKSRDFLRGTCWNLSYKYGDL